MASVLDELVIKLIGDTQGFRVELNKAESLTRTKAASIRSSVQGIGRDFQALGGSIGGLLGSGGIVFGLTRAAQAAQEAEVGTRLFQNQLRRTGQDVTDGTRRIEALADRLGVVPETIQDSVTQLLRQGLTIGEISQTFEGAAASSLAAGRSTSEGIDAVTQAIVNQSSVYLNYAGIAENLDVAYKDYARTLGRSVDSLTKQERAQAAVALVTRSTKEEVADLDTLLGGLTGAQNRVTRELKDAQIAFGNVVREGLTPLLDTTAQALELFNRLPGPVKAALAAFAAGAGGVTVLATAIGALSLALGPLVGPAGLLILAAGAAAALATQMGGDGGLAKAADEVDEAFKTLAGSDGIDGFISSLETLGGTLKGDARAAWDTYVEGIRNAKDEIKDLAVAEAQAAQFRARLGLEQSLGTFGARSSLGGIISTEGEGSKLQQIERALADNDLDKAIALLKDAQRSFAAVGDDLARSQVETVLRLAQSEQNATSILEALRNGALGDGTGTGNGNANGNGGTASGSRPRTVADVLADLDTEQRVAQQRAEALGGTLTAQLESVESQVSAVGSALDEALALEASTAQIQDLTDRLAGLEAQARGLKGQLLFQNLSAEGSAIDRRAAAEIAAGGDPSEVRLAALQEKAGLFENALTELTGTLKRSADDPEVLYVTRRLTELGDEAEALGGRLARAVDVDAILEASRQRLARGETAPDPTEFPTPTRADRARLASSPKVRFTPEERADQAIFDALAGGTRTGQTTDSEYRLSLGFTTKELRDQAILDAIRGTGGASENELSVPTRVDWRTEQDRAIFEQLQGFRGQTTDLEGRVSVSFTARELQDQAILSALGGTGGVSESEQRIPVRLDWRDRQDEAIFKALAGGGLRGLTDNPFSLGLTGFPFLMRPERDTQALGVALGNDGRGLTREDFERAAAQGILMTGPDGVTDDFIRDFTNATEDSADKFAQTVVQSGVQFTQALVQGLRTGDIGGIISGTTGAAANILGAIPGLGLLGTLLGAGGGILGSLISGDQADKREERSRAAERLNRQGPTALEVNATFQQTNQFNAGITDPAVGVALRDQNSQFLREFEKLLARTIIPRLDRLEEVTL